MIEAFYAKLQKKEKTLFLAAIVFVALAIMDRAVLGPILAELKVLQTEITQQEQAIQRNLRILSFKDSILREYSEISVYLDTGEKSREEIVSSLLKMIENLARQKSITISNIQSGDVEENPLYNEYITGIQCEGSLHNLLEFMDALEVSDFLFRILKFQLAAKSKKGDILTANIDIARVLIEAEITPAEVWDETE